MNNLRNLEKNMKNGNFKIVKKKNYEMEISKN